MSAQQPAGLVVEESGADVLHEALVRAGYSHAQFAQEAGLRRESLGDVMAGRRLVPPAMAAAAEVVLGWRGLAEWVLVAQARAEAVEALRTLAGRRVSQSVPRLERRRPGEEPRHGAPAGPGGPESDPGHLEQPDVLAAAQRPVQAPTVPSVLHGLLAPGASHER